MKRALTAGEIALAEPIFGDAIDYSRAQISDHKWAFFQPRNVAMTPSGCIHFHPHGGLYRPDFAADSIDMQAFFLHELTHVWQHQQGIFLPLRRHPFCRYDYALKPGWTLKQYGIEQQAEIVRHVFLLREGRHVPGAPPLSQYEGVLPF